MSRAWFKFYGRDFRDGVRDLSPDVVGIYCLLLTLMYEEADGRIKDHDQRLCRLLGCDVRVWKRARATLLESGKLSLADDGFLTNERVEIEVRAAQDLSEVRRKSGTSSGEVRRKFGRSSPQLTVSDEPKPLKIKEAAPAIAPNLQLYARALPESEPESEAFTPTEKDSVGVKARKRRAPKLAQRSTAENLPAAPTDAMLAAASARGFVNGSAKAEFDKWRDYHLARATEIADHEASFRTWIGKAIEFRKTSASGGRPSDRPAIYPNPYRG